MNPKLLPILLPTMCLTAWSAPVSFESLLHEMTDRDRLASLPEPAYSCRQFSSYNRASTSPDDLSTWFANNDYKQFLRTEPYKGKTQHVMMDAEGPGAIVRIWMTWDPRPENMVRVFIDGGEEPAIEAPLWRFIDGGELAGPPLSAGVAPQTEYAQRGHNLYVPIPYAKHCKVTYEGPIGKRLYYQINYRTYEAGTEVRSFKRSDLDQARATLEQVQQRLPSPAVPATTGPADLGGTIEPGAARQVDIAGPAAIRKLAVRLRADDMEQALRSTVLAIEFDGRQTVWCPLGDFFGTGHQLHPSRTWYTGVADDGTLSCLWVMPFETKARISIHNHGGQPVDLTLADISSSPWDWTDRSMHFHSTWHELRHKEVKAKCGTEDANYVTIQGNGVYVGDTLTIFNGAAAWWGEGDEKIFVDGEKFPSHFGTGTEDYYGYAWGLPASFSVPFLAQPTGAGNKRPGMTVNSRYRALDAIPFDKSLKFDMELWHWANTRINYAPTTFWYARPGATTNITPEPAAAAMPVARTARDLIDSPRVNGAIEGESMKILIKTGGTTKVQDSTKGIWSGNQQLWWMDGKPGERLVLEFQSGKAGRHRVLAHLTAAPDYGIHRISINGGPAKVFDAYHTEVIRKPVDLGIHDLKAGANQLEVIIDGANEQAEKRHMFGLDCILLSQP